jgi:hypothetical protein
VLINKRDKLMKTEIKVDPRIKELHDEFTGTIFKPTEGNIIIDILPHSARIFITQLEEELN